MKQTPQKNFILDGNEIMIFKIHTVKILSIKTFLG